MKEYSGFEWLLIDAATQYGNDKMTFEKRIEWAQSNLHNLEALTTSADKKSKPLYIKAVMAIRKALQGVPTGHLVGADGVCSGMQLMSVLTGCVAGATATGLVDPDRRADAYTDVTAVMNRILGGTLNVSRADAKDATMTTLYGSKAQPKSIFGENTDELAAFYEAIQEVATGAWELLQVLLASWQAGALQHDWKLPDGYDAVVRVMTKKELRIEVDELDHSSFSYEYYENQGQPKGRANAANCVHSVDAYVLREMHRRCNYDREVIEKVSTVIQMEMIARSIKESEQGLGLSNDKIDYYRDQYNRSTLASSVILPYITTDNVYFLSDEHLDALAEIVSSMLKHKPFELVTVHDEFKAHPNNINSVRKHYRDILVEMADSSLLDDLLTQIHKEPVTYNKLSFNLGDLIKKSNYALC